MWPLREVAVSIFIGSAALGFARAQPSVAAETPASPDVKQPAASPEPAKSGSPAPEAGQAAAPSGKTTTQAVVMGLDTLEGVVGKTVRSETANEDMGRIVDILVGSNGETRAAVIDFGGFLGVGSRKVAVDWKALSFAGSMKSGSAKVSLTRDQIRQSPAYKSDEPVVILQGAKAGPSSPPSPPAGKAAP